MTDGQRKKVASSFIAWRFFLVSIVIAAVFVALASRAAYIQILEPDMAIDENNKTLDYKFWQYTSQNNPIKNLAIVIKNSFQYGFETAQ